MELSKNKKIIISLILIVAAVLSATKLTTFFSNPETYEKQIAQIDKTSENVLIMVGIATAASAIITAVPDDFGTPIAEKLTDISEDLAIILFAVYLEKYLMILSGWVAFRILFPVACLLCIIGLWISINIIDFKGLATKILILGIVITFIVPSSLFLSQKINEICDYEETIEAAMEEGEYLGLQADDNEKPETTEAPKHQGIGAIILGKLSNIKDAATDVVESIAGFAKKVATLSVDDILSSARSTLNNLIEATIVLMVTSCGIPILVLVFYVLVLKWLFNVDIDTRRLMKRPSKRIKGMLDD